MEGTEDGEKKKIPTSQVTIEVAQAKIDSPYEGNRLLHTPKVFFFFL